MENILRDNLKECQKNLCEEINKKIKQMRNILRSLETQLTEVRHEITNVNDMRDRKNELTNRGLSLFKSLRWHVDGLPYNKEIDDSYNLEIIAEINRVTQDLHQIEQELRQHQEGSLLENHRNTTEKKISETRRQLGKFQDLHHSKDCSKERRT